MTTHVVADIHISTSASSAPLPTSPLPLDNATHLTPSTQLRVPLHADGHAFNNLADSIDSTRAHLNAILTTWKDWAGKEVSPAGASQPTDDQEEDEDEEDEE
ncbi:uncharacterized protein PAN0_007d3160 [Moesziomyces antarcticus]|uniref:Uncharacterized protein n=2 Tax=Pseudozyma antarctica TaxID=84753 RepID=A0A081CE48_PSEA2|nr:uncharacterized protein PAN0_007d3160 [Moesziomyces antarcticus]GAK64944.1 hypothetical protein PAN0_007d3160 [Moesziomyces antarcticus]SPO46070.1 uncharacterized protein PSANT_03756 [Moesziomyces antarcticus]